MSFDLFVFNSAHPITAQEAVRRYIALCERNDEVHHLVEPDTRVAAFATELFTLYPSLSKVAEEDVDNSPWNSDPDISTGHVIVAVRWSRCDIMKAEITDMAHRYGLIVYNPQDETVYLPPSLQAWSKS